MRNAIEKSQSSSNTIMVVSPISSVGKLIIQSLKEAGVNDAVYFSNTRSAISYIQKHRSCKVALLDLEMGELGALTLSQSLRSICRNLKLVFSSKQGLPEEYEYMLPWKLLRKPYQLTELLNALEITPLAGEYSPIIDVIARNLEVPEWLMDPFKANKILARMISQTDAQEVLVFQNDHLWSFAGNLPEKSIHDIDQYVMKQWEKQGKDDFIGYPILTHESTKQVLYATNILLGVILAVVFDIKIPITKLRNQTKSLASMLRQPELAVSDFINPGDKNSLKLVPANTGVDTRLALPSIKNSKQAETNLTNKRFDDQNSLENKKIMVELPNSILMKRNENYSSTASDKNENIVFKSVTTNLFSLSYTFLITPRNISQQYYPFKDQDLSDWLSEINIGRGGNIDQIEVKREYVSWTANVSPFISLADYIDIVRHELSNKIFEKLPHLWKEYPTGDFWAPGYIIRGGHEKIPSKLISDYLMKTSI
jgi:CheY-like chemotaxis protein